jgi:hypothetical protein
MRFIQHKAEARWFYRVVSLGYDRLINPLFWTAPMRDAALALARLDDRTLEIVDVGAGTGFATEAIVAAARPERVTMLDQSPHQLARRLSDAWMLFPAEAEYVAWFQRAGFEHIERVHVAPLWWQQDWDPYAIAIAGVKPRAGEPPLDVGPPAPGDDARPVTPARLARFAAGSLAGAAFIPVALWFTLVQRLRRR